MTIENRNQKSNWFRESFEATKACVGADGFPRTRTKRLFPIMVLASVPALVLVPATAQAQCSPTGITFEFFFLPDNVIVGTSQDMFVCLANVCNAHDISSDDKLKLSIPVGTKDTDLIHPDDVGNLDCIDAPDDWQCEVNIMYDPDNPTIPINAIVTFQPAPRNRGDDVCVEEFATLCFTLTNVGVNSAEGNTLSRMDQFISSADANDPVNRVLSVFKSLPGGPGAPSPWQTMGNDIFYNDGKVGIGTTMPQSPLDVVGEILGDELTISGLVMADKVESTTSGFIFPDGTSQITAAGPVGLTGYQIIPKSFNITLGFGEVATFQVDCPPGKVILGGGASQTSPGGPSGSVPMVSSNPVIAEINGWSAQWVNTSVNLSEIDVVVFAICACNET